MKRLIPWPITYWLSRRAAKRAIRRRLGLS